MERGVAKLAPLLSTSLTFDSLTQKLVVCKIDLDGVELMVYDSTSTVC